MKLTAELIRQAADGIDSVANLRFRSYSCTSTAGREVAAVVFEDIGDLVMLGMSLAYGVAAATEGIGWEDAADDIDTAVSEWPRPVVEDFGLGSIAYWPEVPFDVEGGN